MWERCTEDPRPAAVRHLPVVIPVDRDTERTDSKRGAVTAHYTRGEVVFLLSLSREDAIAMDADQRDSCAGLSEDPEISGSAAESDVPMIARWVDVQRARRAVISDKEGLAITQLLAGGLSEREIARLSDRDRMAVRRRWHATVDEIIDELGGSTSLDVALSHVDLCLRCGKFPRVYLAPVKRRVRGGYKIVQRGRHASVCRHCLNPELAFRILGEVGAAA